MIVATVSEKVDMKQSELDSFKDEPGLTLSALPLSERAYSVTSEPPVSLTSIFIFQYILFEKIFFLCL